MANRIRHLEYYGYIDQNRYNGIFNLDLSDLYETNSEQDADIDELSGITQGKADLSLVESLSGKVDTFIDTQKSINNRVVHVVSGIAQDLKCIEEANKALTDSINGIVDNVNDLGDDVDSLSARTDDLESKMESCCSGASSVVEDIEEIKEELDGMLSKEEADAAYALKEDVYTKGEIDSMLDGVTIDGVATQEWVRSQGYLTSADGDERYATRERLVALEDRVTDLNADLSKQYSDLNIKVDNGLNRLNNKIQIVETNLDTLSSKHDREISDLSDKCTDLSSKVGDNTSKIEQIQTVSLPSKADKTELEALSLKVDNVSNALNGKLNVSDFNVYSAATRDKIDQLMQNDSNKADISAVTKDIQALRDEIANEATLRQNADDSIGERIDDIVSDIQALKESDVNIDDSIEKLQEDLQKEISDRKAGDDALMGTAADNSDVFSIYGTRAFALQVAQSAFESASAYTEQAINDTKAYIDDEVYTPLNDKIDLKADIAYVDSACTRIQNSFNEAIDEKVAAEARIREAADRQLANAISANTTEIRDDKTEITRLGDIVSVITSWEPSESSSGWTNEGNGVLDVLHREFHALQLQFESASSINNIAYDTATQEIVITYTNINGEELETRIPLGNLVGNWDVSQSTDGAIRLTKERESDLDPYILSAEVLIDPALGEDNVLQKTSDGLSVSKSQVIEGLATTAEVDEKLSAKADADNVYTKAEVDEKIENIDGNVSQEIEDLRNELTDKIEEEQSARENADTELGNKIDELSGNTNDIAADVEDLSQKLIEIRNELGEKITLPEGVTNIYSWLAKIQETLDNLIDFGTYKQ